jgi:hypothetical protein
MARVNGDFTYDARATTIATPLDGRASASLRGAVLGGGHHELEVAVDVLPDPDRDP